MFTVSIFLYLTGCLFRKNEVFSKIKKWIQPHRISSFWAAVFAIDTEIVMLALHGIVESAIVTPFIAIVSIVLLNVTPKPKCMQNVLSLFRKHSASI